MNSQRLSGRYPTMRGTRHDRFLGRGIALELIGDQYPQDVVKSLEEFVKERFGGLGWTSTMGENVEGIAILVDGPPEPVQPMLHNRLAPRERCAPAESHLISFAQKSF